MITQTSLRRKNSVYVQPLRDFLKFYSCPMALTIWLKLNISYNKINNCMIEIRNDTEAEKVLDV
jgi:hypothetical protein